MRRLLIFDFLVVAAICEILSPSGAGAQLACKPRILYRGETLTVDLPADHEGFDFGITRDEDDLAISFEPAPKDRFTPAITPAEFAAMQQIKLVTTEARGSPFHADARPRGPIAVGPPEPIFRGDGAYVVWIDVRRGRPNLPNGRFEICSVIYFDFLKSKSWKPEESLRPTLGCEPEVLYRGDTLTVDLPADHRGDDFWINGKEDRAISFAPMPGNTFAPMITPQDFARMKQIKLATADARGLPFDVGDSERPIPIGPPAPIFTSSGWYDLWVGPPIDIELDDWDFASCRVEYLDYPRPASVKTESSERTDLACQPGVLYRGDTLTVDLPRDHDGFDFQIIEQGRLLKLAGGGSELEFKAWDISFKPTPEDRFAPVIAPAEFARMKQVKLVTTEANGLVRQHSARLRGPAAMLPPEPIFTSSQQYTLWIDPVRGRFDRPNRLAQSCSVDYFDYPRPKSASAAQ